MKIWLDDIRPAPDGYVWCKSVNEAKEIIGVRNLMGDELIKILTNVYEHDADIEVIDIDHDAGDYAEDGGDYIKLLDWMEEIGYTPNAIHIHSMNPVGIQNMRRVIQKNGWREV